MNKNLMFMAANSEKREKDDFYATHPDTVRKAMPELKNIGLSDRIWECACGQGHMSEVLKEEGFDVYSSDLVDRGYGDTKDFLQTNELFNGDIVTNPPFKLAEEFVRHGFELIPEGNKVCMFLKIQFLESKARKKLFEQCPLKYLLVYSERQLCSRNAQFEQCKATVHCYAWYVFEKGYNGEPVIRWI